MQFAAKYFTTLFVTKMASSGPLIKNVKGATEISDAASKTWAELNVASDKMVIMVTAQAGGGENPEQVTADNFDSLRGTSGASFYLLGHDQLLLSTLRFRKHISQMSEEAHIAKNAALNLKNNS